MNRYSLVIMILSLAIAALSAWRGEWDSLIVPTIGIIVVSAPMIVARDAKYAYDRHLMGIAVVPLVALLALILADQYFGFDDYYPVSLAIQAWASMAFGMMIAVFLNARTEVSLPRRWVIVFALTFACSISALYTFTTIYWMANNGYPLFNFHFMDTKENDAVNMMLMLPMSITTFATIVYAIAFNAYLKRVDTLELSRLWPGGEE